MSTTAAVVVTNHNFERYLAAALDGALEQTHPNTEVVFVDDGSTDGSRDVAGRYGGRIRMVRKERGGQASAINAGLEATDADVILFLDADDVLLPSAVSSAVDLLRPEETVKAHWQLWTIDDSGRWDGGLIPRDALPSGNLRPAVAAGGPDGSPFPPMSGNAWRRSFLERVCPIPEEAFRISADAYLAALAPVYGTVAATRTPQGFYRRHAASNYTGQSFEERLATGVRQHERVACELRAHLERLGLPAGEAAWDGGSWFPRLRRAWDAVVGVVPREAPFVLLDEDLFGAAESATHSPVPFVEREGRYWGPPADDAEALAELARLGDDAGTYVVVAWPAFWWLDHYRGFADHLRATRRCVVRTEDVIVWGPR